MGFKGVVAALDNPKRLSGFSLLVTLFTYLVMIVGSLTRANGAGLSCPDWPKCFGKWIPPLDPLVFLEWFHRTLVFLMSNTFLLLVAWVLIVPAFRARWGKLMGLATGLLIVQIVLGALTVLKLLAPWTVFTHLGNSMLFLTCLLILTLASRRADVGDPAETASPPGLVPLTLVATGAVYLQVLLGVIVSSNYAGLACPDWPTCNGLWFPPLLGAIGLQVIHRFGAYTVTGLILALMLLARKSGDAQIRFGTKLAFSLILVQVALGVMNVFFKLPPALSGAHLAVAVAIWITMVTVSYATIGQRRDDPAVSGNMATVQ